MRCTPVSEWQTRRPPYVHEEHLLQQHAAKAARTGERKVPEGEQAKSGPAQKQVRTYANSYDVGFIFDALHKKRFVDEEGIRIQGRRLTADQVRIPETVVYKGGFPAQWYFHSKVDGRFMKKKAQSIVIPQIFETFGSENGTCDTQVVAVFVGTVGTAGGPANQVVYFDRKKLKTFLYAENMVKDGFLQRFIAPEEVLFDRCVCLSLFLCK